MSVLIQKQAKAIRETEGKYKPKKWAVYAGASWCCCRRKPGSEPSLAPLVGVVASVATAIGAAGGGGLGHVKKKAGQTAEMQRAKHSLVGMLATARR